eukprot:COSAG02_NODE_203_length_29261_cov_20.960395_5_plen_72_part_00
MDDDTLFEDEGSLLKQKFCVHNKQTNGQRPTNNLKDAHRRPARALTAMFRHVGWFHSPGSEDHSILDPSVC